MALFLLAYKEDYELPWSFPISSRFDGQLHRWYHCNGNIYNVCSFFVGLSVCILWQFTIYRLLFMVKKHLVFADCFATAKVFWWIFACEYYENLYKLVTMNVFCGMKLKTWNSKSSSQWMISNIRYIVVYMHTKPVFWLLWLIGIQFLSQSSGACGISYIYNIHTFSIIKWTVFNNKEHHYTKGM